MHLKQKVNALTEQLDELTDR